MVRLEETQKTYPKSITLNFNSTMVRLEDDYFTSALPWTQRFQFHYGTIRRKPKGVILFLHGNFNSTMVRLEVCRVGAAVECKWHFNSTMVRLEASHRSRQAC